MKKKIQIIVITILMICCMVLLTSVNGRKASVTLNEVGSRNSKGEDYIELYNATNETISLDGWFLSDDKENPDRHCLPEIIIKPNEHIVLYADGIGEENDTLNFKLDQNGEQIFLSNPDGEIVDQIYMPSMDLDTAYAREKDGVGKWAAYQPTPGATNAGAVKSALRKLAAPVLSHKSGFYEDSFILTMKAGRRQKIYYTLDGSVPTEEDFLYTDGIFIENRTSQDNVINDVRKIVADWKDYGASDEKAPKATVVRAVAVDRKGNVSEVLTETYLVGLDEFKNTNVLSLCAEPDLLIGEEGIFVTGSEYDAWYLTDEMSSNGIYELDWTPNYDLANFWKSGRENEILGTAQFFEEGTKTFEQNVGVRTQGNFTRLYPKKSIQLFSRNVYSGSSVFDQKFFGKYDSHAVYVSAFPEKAYCMNLMENRNVGLQGFKEYALFINGEYWYTAVVMEKYDETYFAQHYGVDPENVLFEKDREAAVGEEAAYLYDDLLEYLRDESISQEEKCQVLYDEVDIQSFIDWLCFNLYVCNNDVSYKKNCTHWRTIESEESAYGDCKWRWTLYDIDHAATQAEPTSSNFREFSILSGNRFYDALRTSPHFCRQFVLTAMDLMNVNFSQENVERVLGEWGLDLSYGNHFFMKRPEYMIQSLRNEFGLTGTVEEVRLNISDAEAGHVYINTTEADMTAGTWNGNYFTDYSVNISAVANPGYRFVGWEGRYESSEPNIEISLTEGGVDLVAIFEKE